MAKEYIVGGTYFLPVRVISTDAQSVNPTGVEYVYTGNGKTDALYLSDDPDLLRTAGEIAADFRCRENTEKEKRLEELLAEQTQANNRKDKEIEILIDRITKLEAELVEKREKNNG